MPMRRSGKRSSVPFRMRSVHASAAAVHRNTDSSGGRPKSSGCVYHASSNGRRWSATWNTGVTPLSTNARQIAVVRRVRQRTTVDERRRDHREPHAIAREPRQLGREPVRVPQRHMRDGMHPAGAVGRDGRAPAVPRGHVRGERGEVGVERALPRGARSSGTPSPRRRPSGRAARRARTRPSSRAEVVRRSSTRRAIRRGCVRGGRRAPRSDPGTARRRASSCRSRQRSHG